MRWLVMSCLLASQAVEAADMHIIYACGKPAIVHGDSDYGNHLFASIDALKTSQDAAKLASEIIGQLDRDEEGQPNIKRIDADKIAGVTCPFEL